MLKTKKPVKNAENRTEMLKYIQLAINTEKRGIKFYTEAKKNINDYNMSRLMDVLLAQEHIHLRFFTQLYNAEKSKGMDAAAKVAARYKRQAPMRNPLFGKKQFHELTKLKSTIHELFKKAIDFEEKGYDLYMDLAKKVKNEKISTFLKMVAAEELLHEEFIKMHQESVYNDGYWFGMEHVRLQS